MKKIVQLICIALITLSLGCKSDHKTATVDGVGKVDMTNKSVDVNQLYQFYYSNPQTLDERQENEIIDYIIDKDLAPTRSVTGLYYQIIEEGTGERIKPASLWGSS